MNEPVSDQGAVEFERKLNIFLSQIPTETSLAERRLLYQLFKDRWDGVGAVVEIGPFLGGTTRAIAWGMMYNANRQANATLETFDRFGEYRDEDNLKEYIQPLVESGIMDSQRGAELCLGGSFEDLFREIHAPFNYSELIHAHQATLPDFPKEIEQSTAFDSLQDREIGGVFVDGCKSWASTYYAMRFLLPRMQSGRLLIFQDLGWYTCFWISSIVYALRDRLEILANVDATYAFQLKSTPIVDDIEKVFATTPDAMGVGFFNDVAVYFRAMSESRGDLRGELISYLHQIAALATIGEKDAALEILKNLNVDRYAPFVSMVEGCVRSPTYLPGGAQVLW